MSRFLFTTMTATGHVIPKLPIARELVARGHDVHWYTGAAYRSAIEATGAVHPAIRSAQDFGGQTIEEAFPELRGLTGLRMLRRAFERVFIDNAPGMFADCRAIYDERAIDAALAEPLCLAGRWLHEFVGLAWATLGETVLGHYGRDTAPAGRGLPPLGGLPGAVRNGLLNAAHRRIVFAGVTRHYERARATVGLARLGRSFIDALPSPYLYLQATVPAFEYPHWDLPQHVHFIRPLLPEPDSAPRPWPLDGRPVVLVTQACRSWSPARPRTSPRSPLASPGQAPEYGSRPGDPGRGTWRRRRTARCATRVTASAPVRSHARCMTTTLHARPPICSNGS